MPNATKTEAGTEPATERPVDNRRRSLSVRDVLILIRERLIYTLPIAVLLSVAWGYHQLGVPPLFQSVAILQVERPERVILSQDVVETSVSNEVDFNTYLQIFSSSTLAERVVKSLTPVEREHLLPAATAGADSSGGVRRPDLGILSVGAVPRTLIIRVAVTHHDPKAAAFLANRYTDEFIAYLFENLDGKNEYAVSYLRRRAEELLAESNAAEQRLQNYMRDQRLVSLDNSTNLAASRLSVVSSAVQTARLERLALEEQVGLVNRYRAEGRSLMEIAAISRYGTVGEYNRQLEGLQRDKRLMSETYLAKHPKMVALDKAIAASQDQLNQAVDLAIADLEASLAKAKRSEETLQGELALLEQEMFRLRDLSVNFKGLESAAQVAKSSYAAILARLNETTTSKALGKIPVRQVDAARPAERPISPDATRVVRDSVMLGILSLGLLTAAFVYFDDRIKSTHDIEEVLGESLLGIVPDFDAVDENDRVRLVVNRSEPGKIEPFMNLHAAVNLASGAGFPKSIMVASTVPGEGKTILSANLASAFAYHGRRTLLIDCDLRRPMVHHRFDVPNAAGIVHWFSKGGLLADSALSDANLGIVQVASHLWVLTSGGRSNHPTPIFESPAFAGLVDRLKLEFEVVVLDTPPLGAVSDALYVARNVDEMFYVCRFKRAAKKHIRLNLRTLRTTRCRILGLVLNGISRRNLAYYSDYRYYRSYGKYYGQTA